ncbi:MAG: LamG domain-containing protein [Bdellovibrionales bacterium]|nr:LamG domain-containing protein [Bdellovibrionales bacterium]
MGKLCGLLLSLGAALLVACSGDSSSNPERQKTFNRFWTPQYDKLQQYFQMSSSLFGDNSVFFAMVGYNGTVRNPNSMGMTTTSGMVGFATHFDGVDDRVFLPFYGNLNQAVFSLTAWIRVTGGGGDRCVLASRDTLPTRGYAVYVDSSGVPQVRLGNGSADTWIIARGAAIPNNVWTHIAVTFDGSSLRFYQNGFQVGVNFLVYAPNTTRPLYLGAGGTELNPNAADFFNGDIDEVGIWSSVLADTDVQTIYQHAYD